MRVLVLGASGATGQKVVMQLVDKGIPTRIFIRHHATLQKEISTSSLVEIKTGNIHDFSNAQLQSLIEGCDVVISCLGHNLTMRGIFGQPRFLVSDSIRHICEVATLNNDKKLKIILMSTTAYTNKLLEEKRSFLERGIDTLLRLCLPPHRDNMKAADYLLLELGRQKASIEWVSVRPDTLVDHNIVTPYRVEASPTQSPIFQPGKTSRINVAHFMVTLVTDAPTWEKWKYQTPVLYNQEQEKEKE